MLYVVEIGFDTVEVFEFDWDVDAEVDAELEALDVNDVATDVGPVLDTECEIVVVPDDALELMVLDAELEADDDCVIETEVLNYVCIVVLLDEDAVVVSQTVDVAEEVSVVDTVNGQTVDVAEEVSVVDTVNGAV